MLLTPVQTMVMILAIALGTMVTRFTPFLLFPETKKPPPSDYIFRTSSAAGNDGTAGGLLPEGGISKKRTPWSSGTDRYLSDISDSEMEKQCAYKHWRWNDCVYDLSAEGVLLD